MKALSLWQPWATLMALQEKRIETRHWSTGHRGPLLIHAAKHWDRALREMTFGGGIFTEVLARHGIHSEDDLPFGALIAEGYMLSCIETELCDQVTCGGKPISAQEREFGDHSANRFMWIMPKMTAYKALAFKGHQALFDVPDSVVQILRAGLQEVRT